MNLEELTDKELMDTYYEAVECQNGDLIRECQDEMSKRNTE